MSSNEDSIVTLRLPGASGDEERVRVKRNELQEMVRRHGALPVWAFEKARHARQWVEQHGLEIRLEPVTDTAPFMEHVNEILSDIRDTLIQQGAVGADIWEEMFGNFEHEQLFTAIANRNWEQATIAIDQFLYTLLAIACKAVANQQEVLRIEGVNTAVIEALDNDDAIQERYAAWAGIASDLDSILEEIKGHEKPLRTTCIELETTSGVWKSQIGSNGDLGRSLLRAAAPGGLIDRAERFSLFESARTRDAKACDAVANELAYLIENTQTTIEELRREWKPQADFAERECTSRCELIRNACERLTQGYREFVGFQSTLKGCLPYQEPYDYMSEAEYEHAASAVHDLDWQPPEIKRRAEQLMMRGLRTAREHPQLSEELQTIVDKATNLLQKLGGEVPSAPTGVAQKMGAAGDHTVGLTGRPLEIYEIMQCVAEVTTNRMRAPVASATVDSLFRFMIAAGYCTTDEEQEHRDQIVTWLLSPSQCQVVTTAELSRALDSGATPWIQFDMKDKPGRLKLANYGSEDRVMHLMLRHGLAPQQLRDRYLLWQKTKR